MTRFYFGILIVLMNILVACTNTTSKETTDTATTTYLSDQAQILYTEVGAVHDTAMVLMGPLERTQMSIRKTFEYVNDEVKEMGLQRLTDLTKAGEAMMDWMHEFKGIELYEEDYKVMTEEEILKYLNQEKVAMEQIDQQMRSAIQEGRAYLQHYSKSTTHKKEK